MARGRAIQARPQWPAIDLPYIRTLHERPSRERSRLYWAEGCRNFHCARRASTRIHAAVVCPSILRGGETWRELGAVRREGVPCIEVTEDEFLAISTHAEPQGVGIVAEQRWESLIDLNPVRSDLWVVVDNVRTPGNLGTILRTCAAVGAQGIMLIGGETDPHDPACIRASMGAIFDQRLIRTSAKALSGWRKRHPCRIVGTSPAARLSYRDACYRGPLLIMMGSERSGLRDRQLQLCDQVVSLPMTGRVDSLNLAVATGVILYEAIAQRSVKR